MGIKGDLLLIYKFLDNKSTDSGVNIPLEFNEQLIS